MNFLIHLSSNAPVIWVPCVESAVTAFLKSSHQTLKSISKRRKCACKLPKCSNYQAVQNWDHCQIKYESSTHPRRSSPDFHTAQSRPLTPSPGRLQAAWKWGYEEVKASVHRSTQGKHKLVNMRWLFLLSPGHTRGVGVGHPRETQAGEYEVIVPGHARGSRGGGWGLNDWCINTLSLGCLRSPVGVHVIIVS